MNIKRISVMSATVLSTGLISLGSVAAADGGSWYSSQHSFSNRSVRNTFTERNTNNVRITNTNNQTAITGSATVSGNLFGGSARSGNAMNYNSSSFDVDIQNR